MKIAIWWEQVLWGGVDTHLLTLLRNWPSKTDSFYIFYNPSNQGMSRISREIISMDRVICVELKNDPYGSMKWVSDELLRVVRFFTLPLRFYLMKNRYTALLKSYGRFDVLLADNGGYPGAWGALASILSGRSAGIGVRILLIHHGAAFRRPFRQTLENLIDHFIQSWVTDLVTVSYATRDTLINRRGFDIERRPIRVIYNGVDVDSSDSDAKANFNIRDYYDISSDEFIVGMLGRLERHKGQEDLILALEKIGKITQKKIVLVFVGGGSSDEKHRLERLTRATSVEDNVKFSGYIPDTSSSIIKQFDILAMLTKDFEGFGLTIAESMIVETPVIATNVGAVSEFVDQKICHIIRPESPEDIAESVMDILNNKDKTHKMTILAKNSIKKFNGESMSRNFFELIRNSEGNNI